MNTFTLPFMATQGAKARGLLVTHRGQRCGVWQFGARLHHALVAAGGIDWHYVECANLQDFEAATAANRPDVVLVNFHPSTLPWAAEGLHSDGAVTFAVFHEASQASVAALRNRPFDVFLCPDPTLLPYDPRALPVPRFIPSPLRDLPAAPDVFTIGSFGFGTPGKGFEKLCGLVNAQCAEARIRINIPPHDDPAIVSPAQVANIVDACRAAVTRSGISLEITHDFLDEAGLLHFLATNTLNAFLYDDAPGRGISSCTDYALAAGRPIAVTRTSMFRHLTGINPSICVEDRSLAEIAATGIGPLQIHCSAYTEAAAGAAWNATILDALVTLRAARAVPDGRGFNKLLDDRARAAYVGPLEDLHRLAPETLSRKIERANIQQAFALDTARRLASRFDAPRILAIGSYEDTTCASLRALGYRLDEVDPQVNGLDLEAFYRSPTARAAFEIVLCVSVLEHVADDEAFVRQAAALLAPGGIAIFTVDFSERYPETGLRPAADQRLYTQHDLHTRLMGVLPDCALIDSPSWSDGAEDFEYEGCRYAFATWVFRRLPPAVARHAELTERRLGGAPWKALLARDRVSHEREVAAFDAQIAAFRAQRATQAAALARAWDEIKVLQDALATAQDALATTQDAFAVEYQRTERLRNSLRMEDGPRALRAVLPLARVIRWLSLLTGSAPQPPAPDSGPVTTADQSVKQLPANGLPPERMLVRPVQLPSRQPWRRRIARTMARIAYAPIRPVVKPVAWRLRSFVIGPLLAELHHVRSAHAESQSTPAELQGVPSTGGLAEVELRRLAQEMEHALLTLAMEASHPRVAGKCDAVPDRAVGGKICER